MPDKFQANNFFFLSLHFSLFRAISMRKDDFTFLSFIHEKYSHLNLTIPFSSFLSCCFCSMEIIYCNNTHTHTHNHAHGSNGTKRNEMDKINVLCTDNRIQYGHQFIQLHKDEMPLAMVSFSKHIYAQWTMRVNGYCKVFV